MNIAQFYGIYGREITCFVQREVSVMRKIGYEVRRRYCFSACVIALTLGMVSFTTSAQAISSTELLNRLPPSDIIVSIDARKTMDDALPKALGGSPDLLAKVLRDSDEFTSRTGINPKDFDRVVIGASLGGHSFDMIVLASGERIEAGKVVAAGLKEAARGHGSRKETPTEEFQGHTLYAIEGNLATGMLVTELDGHTLAFGNAANVRAMLGGNLGQPGEVSAANADLIKLATQGNTNAVLQFAGRMPEIAVPVEGAIGRPSPALTIIAAVREFNGSFAVESGEARFMLSARTRRPEQAQQITEQLKALKELAAVSCSAATIASAENQTSANDTQADSTGDNDPRTQGREKKAELPADVAQTGGQSVVLPGLGLIVAAPGMDVIKDLVVESSGDEVRITLKHPLPASPASN